MENNEVAEYGAVAPAQERDWMELSKEYGLAIFERQPEESAVEWQIWTTYRQFYPMRLPKWTELAAECGTTVGTVVKTSQKWSFNVRLQAWARFTDDMMAEDRAKAIQEMNARQLDMACRLQEKIATGIDYIDPMTLKPTELGNLMKLSTELERRIKIAAPERVQGAVEEAGKARETMTKAADLSSVISILQQAGVLDGKTVGVEQQTTTRLLAKDESSDADYADTGGSDD